MAGPRQKCDLYLLGHQVHWIPALRSSEVIPSIGTLVEVADGEITVEYLEGLARYRNHRAERLLKVAKLGTRIKVCERYRILGVDLKEGRVKLFCIALDDDEWRSCSFEPLTSATPEALAERLNTRGGFSVPSHQAMADLGRGDHDHRAGWSV